MKSFFEKPRNFFNNNKLLVTGLCMTALFVASEANKWYVPEGMDSQESEQDPCQPLCSYNVVNAIAEGGVGYAASLLKSMSESDLLSDVAPNLDPQVLFGAAWDIMRYCGKEVCAQSLNMSHCMASVGDEASQNDVVSALGFRQLFSGCGNN